MIRIRQVKIPVKKDSEEYIKTKLKKCQHWTNIAQLIIILELYQIHFLAYPKKKLIYQNITMTYSN